MADELKTDVVDEPKTEVTESFSQAEVDRIVSQRVARESTKYSDYFTLKEEAETLKAEKQKREDEDLSENQKLEKQLSDKNTEIESLNEFKNKLENWEKSEIEKIDTDMVDFPDEDRDLVNSLPLEKRATMIIRLKDQKDTPSPQTGKFIDGKPVPSYEDAQSLKIQFGVHSSQYKEALALRMQAK